MNVLCLTMRILDLRTRTSAIRRFLHSPVTIGSGERRTVRLEATGVSELHGVFRFDSRSVEYVDLGSLTGSLVDGASIAPQIPTAVSEASVVRVADFEISAHAREVVPLDTADGDDGSAQLSAILATRIQRDRIQAMLVEWPPKRLLARCLAVFEILAEVVVELRPQLLASVRPPLHGSATVDDIIAFLLDPSGGDDAIEALYAQVLAMLRPQSVPPASEGSS